MIKVDEPRLPLPHQIVAAVVFVIPIAFLGAFGYYIALVFHWV